MAYVVADWNGDATIEAIDAITHQSAPEESDGDVARIVDTEIEARPAVDELPGHHETDKQAVAHQEREEQGNGERVRRMS